MKRIKVRMIRSDGQLYRGETYILQPEDAHQLIAMGKAVAVVAAPEETKPTGPSEIKPFGPSEVKSEEVGGKKKPRKSS